MIGQTISHYKILDKLGEGGMGVVYKAQDTTLDRLVALKFLPPHVSSSSEDKARFIQEAKAAASLSHPNICTIHGAEEYEGKAFIVMEFVEGKTLKDIKEHLPLKHAIEIGIQLADGLAAAHEKGIVHRDIKPENIMIRKDGRLQIMDFGLAKLKGVSRLTKEGSTVGTAGYMSPEQVQGLDADHRTDIFSMGVLLYELFAGESPFKGVHETAISYEIVNVDPQPISSLKPDINPELDGIVLDCLAKEPAERSQSAAEVAKDLRHVKRESSGHGQSRMTSARVATRTLKPAGSQEFTGWFRLSGTLPWYLAAMSFLGMLVVTFAYIDSPREEKNTVRAYLPAPEKSNFFMYGNQAGPATISRDGKNLTFVAVDSSGKRFLYVWALGAIVPYRLEETEGALYPFWSPDNHTIGFFDQYKLKKIDASGGSPIVICDAVNPRGATWNAEGKIVFSPGATAELLVVSASGGTAKKLTTFDNARKENSHRWPSFLPDGKHFLYFARTAASSTQREDDVICVASADEKDRKVKVLVRASSNAEYASGRLLYIRGTSLVAQRLEEAALELTGEAEIIDDGIAFDKSTLRSLFTVSHNGILVYQKGTVEFGSRLFLYDRTGKRMKAIGGQEEYLEPRLSADGKKIATDIYSDQARNRDLWTYDLERNTKERLTVAPTYERSPIWSHDGKQIYFSSDPEGVPDFYRKPSSGLGNEQIVWRDKLDKLPLDITGNSKFLLFREYGGEKTQMDLWILPLEGEGQPNDRKPIPFRQTRFNETDGRFSPDGHWIAYTSNESGQYEIWISSFPASGGQWQVSTSGGVGPRWRRDGRELYYLGPNNTIMAAEIDCKATAIEVTNVRPLFETPMIVQLIFPSYDVSGDGKSFLINVQSETQNKTPLSLVVNWDAAFKKK
jgi:serine/threonine protein kinase/Tol biopolymer transport system component